MRRTTLGTLAGLSGLLALALAAPGCGGGDGAPSICVAFLAGATPAPSTAVAQPASGSVCDIVVVEIVLTDVSDVFTVDFTVSFDPSVARYEGYSLAGSRLTSDAAEVEQLEMRVPPPPEEARQVILGLTRVNPSTGIDFTGTQTVVRLLFRKALASGTGSSPLTFSDTKVLGSEEPPQEKPGITWSGGTFQVQ